jgi:hypothetical protein
MVMQTLGRWVLGGAVVCLSLVGFDPVAAETPLTNADVVALCEAGLGDAVVIAKIKQAPSVDFHLEVDDLVSLRDHGVSETVVTAMLTRATPISPPVPAEEAGVIYPSMIPGLPNVTVSLVDGEGARALPLQLGDFSMTGFGPVQVGQLDFSGTEATTRSSDRTASLRVESGIDPKKSADFTLVKLEVDRGDRVRSLDLGTMSPFHMGPGEFLKADEDAVLRFQSFAEGDGVWRIQPVKELRPGEYGLYSSGGIYGFGID